MKAAVNLKIGVDWALLAASALLVGALIRAYGG